MATAAVTAISNYLGFGQTPPTKEDKNALWALPSSWYTSQEMYELERRAIFSRKWQLVTHQNRLDKPGDWLKFNIDGFSFVVARDLHVHIDCNGFMWVSLDAKKEPEVAWEDDFKGIDRQDRYKQFNFDDNVFDHFWEMEVNYNCKILADNYNECYHCATTHPDIPALADIASYSVQTRAGQIIQDAATTDEQRKNGLTVASTTTSATSTNISPHFFMVQRFVPSGQTTSMQYQVFRNKHSSEDDFQLVNDIYKRIMSEDKYLCDLAQKNLPYSLPSCSCLL